MAILAEAKPGSCCLDITMEDVGRLPSPVSALRQDQEPKMINIPAGSVDQNMVLDLLDHLVLYQCEHLVLH